MKRLHEPERRRYAFELARLSERLAMVAAAVEENEGKLAHAAVMLADAAVEVLEPSA